MNKGGTSKSENVSQQKRALMLPQEIKEIPQNKEIISLEYTKPIMAERAVYYNDPVFIDRLKQCSTSLAALGKKLPDKQQLERATMNGELSIEVPLLNMDLHKAIVEHRVRKLTEQELEQGIDLSSLAHNFDQLPELDDKDNPSAASIDQFVESFFTQLNKANDETSVLPIQVGELSSALFADATIANATQFQIKRIDLSAIHS